jgi:hypothetical protein
MDFYAINKKTQEAMLVSVPKWAEGTSPLANAVASLPNGDWKIVGEKKVVDAALKATEYRPNRPRGVIKQWEAEDRNE